jgi:nucleoid-associated protein YgaU
MSTPDPIQMLIDAGALPQSPFDEASRYRGVPLALHPGGPGELPRPYVRRRFIAQRRDIAVAAEWLVTAGDRPELLAARALDDPLAYWRIADANAVTDPFELTDTPGARVVLPVPTAG